MDYKVDNTSMNRLVYHLVEVKVSWLVSMQVPDYLTQIQDYFRKNNKNEKECAFRKTNYILPVALVIIDWLVSPLTVVFDKTFAN